MGGRGGARVAGVGGVLAETPEYFPKGALRKRCYSICPRESRVAGEPIGLSGVSARTPPTPATLLDQSPARPHADRSPAIHETCVKENRSGNRVGSNLHPLSQ